MLSKTKVKYIQSLSHKKFRDESQIFIIEGPKLVEEFLQHRPSSINAIYALPPWLEANKNLLSSADKQMYVPVELSDLEKISLLSTPNQVLALVKYLPATYPDRPQGKISLLLDGIQDPGNMGTIIRTADWFGVSDIICSKSCAEIYNPKVVQATMGSILRVNVYYTDLLKYIDDHKNIPVFASALNGSDLHRMEAPEEGLLIIGNESKGISPELLSKASKKITIPRFGKSESLNAAVATGIILSHFRMRR